MKKFTMMIAVGCFAAVSVHAASAVLGLPEKPNAFTYNYAELSYVGLQNVGAGRGKDDYEGIKASASSDIDTNVSLIGSALLAQSDSNDLNILNFGTAYHQEVKDVDVLKMDVIFHGGLEYVNLDHVRKNHDASDFGLNVGAGVRALIVSRVELSGDVSVSSNDINRTAVTGGASYIFTPEMQAMLNVQLGDFDMLSLGVRYNF